MAHSRMWVVASQSKSINVQGPPPAYDHKKQLKAITKQLVTDKYPQLTHLVESGTLIAIKRDETAVERRTDGYKEPELILIVGTAHLSQQSAEDVRLVIETVENVDNVCVELCRSRSVLLYNPPSTSSKKGGNNLMAMGGSNLLEAFTRTMRLGGQSSLILRLLLGSVSSQLSQQVGIDQTGIEFRAAKEAAERQGAELVLGDRPIEITLKRAWDALGWQSRIQLLLDLLSGVSTAKRSSTSEMNSLLQTNMNETASLIDRLNDDDAVSFMLGMLGERYPAALSPLVHERDLYLAWSLSRSKAVNGARCVVGVIGRGHMRGVCYALTHNSGGKLRFRDLAGSRKGGDTAASVVQRLILETAVVSGIIYAWSSLYG